jgi:hypothetical protein
MAYERVVVMLPEVKRATLGGNVKYKKGFCTFKTKAGKKITIPADNVLLQDAKSIWYRLLKRKIIKGSFDLTTDGFLEDSDIGRINPEILSMGEEKKKLTAEEKKAAKKKAAVMAKARASKKEKTPTKKLKIKKKKK